VLISSRFPVRT